MEDIIKELKKRIDGLEKGFRVIAFIGDKGGVGRTSLIWNIGETLAEAGKKILFLDLDHQCNLSQTYGIYTSTNTVADVFHMRRVEPINVKENIDIIPGDLNIDEVEVELSNKIIKNQILYMWMEDNQELIAQYDVVLIDCHPGFGLATKNAIAVSHSVFSPLNPSKYGYEAKYNLELRMSKYRDEEIDTRTRESYITANLLFIANKIAHNKNSSKAFLKSIQEEKEETGISDVVAFIPEKELINTSTLNGVPLIEMEKDRGLFLKHRDFFRKFNQAVLDIYEAA